MDTASVCRGAATLHKKGAATSESYAKASSRASPTPRSATNTDHYAPDCDGGVAWDSVGIDWGLDGAPVLSAKDAAAPALADFDSPFSNDGPFDYEAKL